MVDVINLGTFGKRRESDLSGLSESLLGAAQVGAQLRRAKSVEEANRMSMALAAAKEGRAQAAEVRAQATELRAGEEAKRKAARHTLEQRKRGLEAMEAIQEKLSLRRLNSDEPMWSTVEKSDWYRALVKDFKQYAPELVEGNKVILLSKDELFRKERAQLINAVVRGLSQNLQFKLAKSEEERARIVEQELKAYLSVGGFSPNKLSGALAGAEGDRLGYFKSIEER